MNPVVIVVYRVRREVVDRTFIDIMEQLRGSCLLGVSCKSDKNRIDIGEHTTILFRSGDIYKLEGMRCAFYDAWWPDAARRLAFDNAKKIDIFKFIDVLIAVYETV